MKKLMLSMIAFSFSAIAFADVPMPTTDVLTVSGTEAAELAKSLPGTYAEVSQFAGGRYVVKRKVQRASTGLSQIVCRRVEIKGGGLKYETCEMQKSGNGVPLNPAE